MKKIPALILFLVLMLTFFSGCKGGTLPYDDSLDGSLPSVSPKEFAQLVEMTKGSKKVYFEITENGIAVNGRYSQKSDISYYLCRKGPNNIFDFSTVGLVKAETPISSNITPTEYLINSSGDWHSPYVVKAVNNSNGDNTTSGYFTGGNHGNDNTATCLPTGRTDNLIIYVDIKTVTEKTKGYADSIRIEWDNYIQGYNTTKSNGSGREILREHISLEFDGYKWETETTIYPLEDIVVSYWYGIQFFSSRYDHLTYIGGKNGKIYDTNTNSDSGSSTANGIRFFSDTDTAIMEIDTDYDLGSRKFASGEPLGFFARGSYNKAYCSIINTPVSLSEGETYSLRGSYIFKYELQNPSATNEE